MGGDVGESIREKRKKAGMTQAELANLAGISQSAISDIESRKKTKKPNIDTISKIAHALSCPVGELVADEGIKKENPSADGEELREKVIDLLVDLPKEDVQRVRDFVAGMKAARKGS